MLIKFLRTNHVITIIYIFRTEGDLRDPHARRAVVVMERAQLEDKHLRLMEENLVSALASTWTLKF